MLFQALSTSSSIVSGISITRQRQGVLQAGEFQQILNQELQAAKLLLQPLDENHVVLLAVDRHLQALTHQHQCGQRRSQFMGDVADPALLLLLLGFKGLTALKQDQNPFL